MGVPSPGRRVIRWEWMARPSRDCVGREAWSVRISTIELRTNGTSLVTCAPLVLIPGTGPAPPETLPGTNARNRSSNGDQTRRAKRPQLFTRCFPGAPINALWSCRGSYPQDFHLPQARLPGVWVVRCCSHAVSGASASPHFPSEAGVSPLRVLLDRKPILSNFVAIISRPRSYTAHTSTPPFNYRVAGQESAPFHAASHSRSLPERPYFVRASIPALATCASSEDFPPLTPIAPTTFPSMTIGIPPSLGRTSG